ncbi:MAG: iron-sulfur cluster assembly scaffold protein [bacterium]
MYKEEVLEHFKNPKNMGELKKASFKVKEKNSLCGDNIEIALDIRSGKIFDIKFVGSGCALVTASASLLTEYLKGKNLEDLKKVEDKFVINLLGGEITPARISCALLPLKALKKIKE